MDRIGRYRVLRPLASGGMGQVFLAEDPTLERQVALKLLHRDPEHGLQAEAKALAALSHPNIVTIFEIGEHEGHDFIAMEYLSGKTLRDILTGARPSREELLAIMSSVCVAVAAAHHTGILHRDIKPENVMITPNGVKVVDFGIARRLEDHVRARTNPTDLYEVLLPPEQPLPDGTIPTLTGDTVASAGTQTVFGTPAYMSPEVLGGEASSAASDIYSLGVLLYECLAGKRPYDAGNLIETIAHIVQAPAPTLDDPVNPLLVRMLAREPADRPHLAAVISALRPTIDVSPPRRPYWGWMIVGACGLAAALAVVFLGPTTHEESLGRAFTHPPERTLRIAIGGVAANLKSWGLYGSDGDALANTLVKILAGVRGAKITGIVVSGQTLEARLAAAKTNASYYLALHIDEDREKPEITGTVVVYDATGKQHGKPKTVTAPSTELQELQYRILDATLAELAPEASLPRRRDRGEAMAATRAGNMSVQAGNFDRARTEFEAAVAFDPSLPEAWYGLALSYGWTEAPPELISQAAEHAHQLAPTGRRKQLMWAVSLFLRERHQEARRVLEAIDAAGDAGPDQRELLYFLGEVNWHDGRYDEGYHYLKRAFEIPPRSSAMAIHPTQYLIARRQGDEARYFGGASGLSDASAIEFSLRHYKQLAIGTNANYRVTSKVVLGEPVSDAEVEATYAGHPIELAGLRAAFAIEAGDRAKAIAIIERIWAERVVGQRLGSLEFYDLESLGEVLISAGLVDQARRLVALLAEQSKVRTKRGYHRLAMLTAALARDPALLVEGPTVSERDQQLGAAATAEIAGDHAKAAALLTAIVENPSTNPERAALLRNLRATHRKQAVAELCKDTLEPATYHHAMIVLRASCRARR